MSGRREEAEDQGRSAPEESPKTWVWELVAATCAVVLVISLLWSRDSHTHAGTVDVLKKYVIVWVDEDKFVFVDRTDGSTVACHRGCKILEPVLPFEGKR